MDHPWTRRRLHCQQNRQSARGGRYSRRSSWDRWFSRRRLALPQLREVGGNRTQSRELARRHDRCRRGSSRVPHAVPLLAFSTHLSITSIARRWISCMRRSLRCFLDATCPPFQAKGSFMRGLAAMPSTLQTGPARFIFDQHRFIRDSLSNAKDAAMFASRISKRQLTPARSGAKTPRHERATDETARFIGASTDVPAATPNFCRISIHSARPGRPLAQLSWAGSPPPVAGQSLPMGRLQDASEQEADRVASRAMSMTLPRLAAGRVTEQATEAPILRAKGGSGGGPHGGDAPGIVHQVLRSEGQALDSGTRSFFEPRFGLDFSHVRVHTDPMAAQSARAVGARAYAVNNRIVFAAGQYQPSSALGRGLLAHELAHTAMSAGKSVLCRQPDSTAAPVRQDFVFLMGADAKKDPNKFYTVAERFYRAHLPKAVFVKSQRSLDGLLKFLAAHVATPAANIYIVAHGNEDGTLAFALDGAEKDHHLTVNQLRAALHPKTGASSLSSVSSAVDANTRIHIKGCDIGRTREMVELLDEAFGGAGTVTAPTHEQDFYTDPYLGAKARQQEHDTRI